MPPHCDSMDGPVVTAARHALDHDDVDHVLPYVHEEGEAEVRAAYASAVRARVTSPAAEDVADRWFFENVVRVHRAGEGAAYTGVEPAGLSEGPVIPLAEKAVLSGSVDEVHAFLSDVLRRQLSRRLDAVTSLAGSADRSLVDARAHVEAMLDFEVFSHHTFLAVTGPAGPHAASSTSSAS